MSSETVATVDGQAIERRAFNHWLEITARTNDKPRAEVRDQVMHQLLVGVWIEGEAGDRGISVDAAAVQRDFERQKRLSFPEDADFQLFLKSSGQTEKDVLERVRLDLLSSRIHDDVTGGEPKVTEQQIAAHFRRDKARFMQPEQRDLRVVVTATRAEAAAARAAALGDAVFEAATGQPRGPVEAADGYCVFEVTRVFRARQQTLDEARPTIERLLRSEVRRKQLDEFTEKFREEWRGRTECREGYVTPDCRNGPDTPPPA